MLMRPTRPPRKNKESAKEGFSLVEILVVIAIISMVTAFAIPSIWNVVTQKLSSTTRKFSGVVRTVRNDSILLNKVHRMVFNLDDQTWWVEHQPYFELLEDPLAEQDEKSEEPPKKSGFTFTSKYSSGPIAMPDGIVVLGIWSERLGFLREGTQFIHFFPNGYIDASTIVLAREGLEQGFGLQIDPASGQSAIVHTSIEELVGK